MGCSRSAPVHSELETFIVGEKQKNDALLADNTRRWETEVANEHEWAKAYCTNTIDPAIKNKILKIGTQSSYEIILNFTIDESNPISLAQVEALDRIFACRPLFQRFTTCWGEKFAWVVRNPGPPILVIQFRC